MAEIQIQLGYLHKYMVDMEQALGKVRFETVNFDYSGNASGLNAYVYSYRRLSNLLVVYRDFARNDILRMCRCIESFIEEDSMLAGSIRGNDIDTFASFSDQTGRTSDAEGMVSLYSIYTSSFVFNYEDLNRFEREFQEQVSNLCCRIYEYRETIEALIGSGTMRGEAANAIFAYWSEVHIPVAEALIRIVMEIRDNYIMFVNGADGLLCERCDCNIPQDALEDASDRISFMTDRIRSISDDISREIHRYSASYGQFINPAPEASALIGMLDQTITGIHALEETIIEYEDRQAQQAKEYIDNAVDEIRNLINGLQDIDQTGYEPGGAAAREGYTYVIDLLGRISEEEIKLKAVKMYLDIADGDRDNLTRSQIRFLRGYMDEIARDRYQGMDNVSDLRSANPDVIPLYIQIYELLNPEQAETVREFMSPVTEAATRRNGYAQDVENILYILYTAEEPYRTVFIDSSRKLKLGDINYDETAYYNSGTQSINLNMDKLRSSSLPYLTLFHEWGHGVDDVSVYLYLLNPSASSNRSFTDSEGMTVKMLLVDEITNCIERALNDVVADNGLSLSDSEMQMIMDHLVSREYIYGGLYPSDWSTDMTIAFRELINYFGHQNYYYDNLILSHSVKVRGILNNDSSYMVLSDIFGAITNNQIGGFTGHFFDDEKDLKKVGMVNGENYTDEQIGDFISKYDYWYNSQGLTYHIAGEFFAEYSSYQIYGNADAINAYRQITPSAASLIDQLYSQWGNN